MMVDANEESAESLLDAGKLAEAEQVLKLMLNQDANCLAAHFQLARVYFRRKRAGPALIHARRTLRLNPTEPNACLNTALIYDQIGNSRAALHYFKRELSRDPFSEETLWNLGRFYFERHRWLAGSKCLQKCLDLGYRHEVEDTLYKLGFCYYKLDNVRAYIAAYEKYLNEVPSSAWASANLGRALLHAKQFKRAVLWLMKAHRLDPRGSVAQELHQARKALAKIHERKDSQP